MDLITLTYDQTLRGMLHGLGPRDLRYFVYTPPHLAEIPENLESYGETPHLPEAIYQHIIGWFDGDVTQLYAIPPLEEAERMVALVGGKDAMLAAVEDARSRHEYAWAAQLVQHLHLLDPDDTAIRQLKADILRGLAHRTTGFAPRSFLLSEARELEGATHIPNLVAPAAEVIAAAPATFVDYLRVRIDPEASPDTGAVVGFTFTGDTSTSVALHISDRSELGRVREIDPRGPTASRRRSSRSRNPSRRPGFPSCTDPIRLPCRTRSAIRPGPRVHSYRCYPPPAKDPEKLAAVREFMSSPEQLDYERLKESHALTDETINGVETMWVVPPEQRNDDKVLIFVHGGGYVLDSHRLFLLAGTRELVGSDAIGIATRARRDGYEVVLVPKPPRIHPEPLSASVRGGAAVDARGLRHSSRSGRARYGAQCRPGVF